MYNSTEASINSTTPFIGFIAYLKICVYSFGLLFGLPIQFYMIYLIITESRSRITSEFFNLNLSVCEIINFLNCLVFMMSVWFSSLLEVAYSISGLGLTGRPLFEGLISVERYLAVLHPVTFLKYKPLRYRVMCCAVAWIISVGSCLACKFLAGSQDFVGHSWFVSIQFFIFISIQLFCCVAVLRALKQSGPGERGREREEENHMKRRAFHLILIITVNMINVYVPIMITGVIIILTQQNIEVVWLPSIICYVLAGFVHPGLYLYRARKLSCLHKNGF